MRSWLVADLHLGPAPPAPLIAVTAQMISVRRRNRIAIRVWHGLPCLPTGSRTPIGGSCTASLPNDRYRARSRKAPVGNDAGTAGIGGGGGGRDTGTVANVSGNVTREPAAGDEHVFAAVVGKRLAGEAAVQRLQFEADDV